ncbi:hypothetical protein LOZ58_006869 [Ophidiomyces ophidiicola]|nr:hypothetical protein LOZ58_006869 [Ophidiomyces ophidiicola]
MSRGQPRALVSLIRIPDSSAGTTGHDSGSLVSIRVTLPRPMKSHPFTIVSWSKGEQDALDLIVQPRRGLTADLLRLAESSPESSLSSPAFISGPHGVRNSVGKYETVLLVASGPGIIAVIPHVKQLIHGYNTKSSRTRRVHFVWQLRNLDIAVAMQQWLNDLLAEDVLGDGYILTMSIYLEAGRMAEYRLLFGNHERAVIYSGPANFRRIIQEEVSGQYILRLPGVEDERGDMLVIASVSNDLRDELMSIAHGYLHEKVRMLRLEFQPE